MRISRRSLVTPLAALVLSAGLAPTARADPAVPPWCADRAGRPWRVDHDDALPAQQAVEHPRLAGLRDRLVRAHLLVQHGVPGVRRVVLVLYLL